jgi:death on curing protein
MTVLYLNLDHVMAIHQEMIRRYGGASDLLDRGLLESAVAQPAMTFGGHELYPTLAEKAAALAFSLTRNHPFQDGNKRVGFGALDVFLRVNGHRIAATQDGIVDIFLQMAAGTMSREQFTDWVSTHCQPLPSTE